MTELRKLLDNDYIWKKQTEALDVIDDLSQIAFETCEEQGCINTQKKKDIHRLKHQVIGSVNRLAHTANQLPALLDLIEKLEDALRTAGNWQWPNLMKLRCWHILSYSYPHHTLPLINSKYLLLARIRLESCSLMAR